MHVIKFFHHLFNPHCVDCREDVRCSSCDTLRDQLIIERATNDRLLKALLEANAPKVEVRQSPPDFQQIPSRAIPWEQTRRRLEAEARARAEVMKAEALAKKEATPADSEIENLEKELGVNDAS